MDLTFRSFDPRNRFELPEPLKDLQRISDNFFWSWNPEGVELFRGIAPTIWDKYEQHPQKVLREVGELRLWQKATDQDYLDKLARFAEKFDRYMAEPPVRFRSGPTPEHPAAYFCAEYGVHNSLPNYSGGLGILAGDHLKSASDMNVPLVAVGLLYRYGYFRQDISHDGWQEEHYTNIFDLGLAITPVTGADGQRIKISVRIRDRNVEAQAWLANIGRISLYLLDTNVDGNTDIDRMITGHLYGGDTETRIVQEMVLGIGGVRLLRKLSIEPSVFHLNEGHAAFSTLELVKEYIAANESSSFADAQAEIRRKCVFTTHTPVAAGNDVFQPSILMNCFGSEFLSSVDLSEDEFFDLGRVESNNEDEGFGMTPFAIRMTRSANGVSEKHGEVSRDLWRDMFDDKGNVPITHVTNGVHAPTWIAPLFQRIYSASIGENWLAVSRDAERWANAVADISGEDIWKAHCTLKNLLVAFIRLRTKAKDTGGRDTINERTDTAGLFSPDVLTIGFARRVAQYKRWNLILSDVDRLLKMVDDTDRPVQFVFAGKAHPQDRTAKQILQDLMSINHESNWQRRAVFIEDYDQEVARYLVQGVDVWMNVPRRPHEASGTSGMKAAMNGVLNLSVLDGWWVEGYNGKNGFAVGDLSDFESDDEIDAIEAEQLYTTLEEQVIPTFYDREANGIPAKWLAMMKESIATLTPQFSSDRMLADYIEKIYKEK